MLKKLVFAALLGLCAAANAQYYQVDAVYTGFYDEVARVDRPELQLKMSALVHDVNGDNAFTLNEVRAFRFEGVAIPDWMLAAGTCVSDHRIDWCLGAFSYTADGALTFSAGTGYDDGIQGSYSAGVTSGHAYRTRSVNWPDVTETGYLWTPGTQAAVTVTAAVPEPATYALLGAGLCAVGFAARRRR